MKAIFFRAAAITLLAVAPCCTAKAGDKDEQTAPAVEAARRWLALVDAGHYAHSWAEAAPIFKQAVFETQWESALKAVRTPLGQLESRELLDAKFTTTLPGAPDGEYVVIQFKTRFAKKAEAIETVTPMKDEQGVWQVSGYFVK